VDELAAPKGDSPTASTPARQQQQRSRCSEDGAIKGMDGRRIDLVIFLSWYSCRGAGSIITVAGNSFLPYLFRRQNFLLHRARRLGGGFTLRADLKAYHNKIDVSEKRLFFTASIAIKSLVSAIPSRSDTVEEGSFVYLPADRGPSLQHPYISDVLDGYASVGKDNESSRLSIL
jgi:hypothetical protein